MKWNSLLAAVAVISTLPSIAHSATQTRTLRVLSYNVKGLPDVITKMDSDRYRDIGRVLAERRKNGTAPDIVLIQEAFVSKTQELLKEAGYPYTAKGPNSSDKTEWGLPQKTAYGSGLFVLSEFPIVETKKVAYDLRFCAVADCGANKGAMMVSIALPGLPRPLKVFNTHAQAERQYDGKRSKQFEIFSRFIEKYHGDDPVLIGGDFNSRPKDRSFEHWTKLTRTIAVGGFCLANSALCRVDPETEVSKAYEDSVDHIFFSPATSLSGVATRPLTMMRNFDDPVGGRVLSDHLGYEAEFEVTWSD